MEVTTETAAQYAGLDYNCRLFDMLTHGLTVLVISVLGTLGNFLSMITFWSTRNENATSLLLLSLAAVDTGVLVTHVIMICPRAFCKFTDHACETYMNFLFPWMTANFWPFASTCHLASTWLVVLVTFNRFVGICYPLKFKRWMSIRRMKIQIGAICIGSFIYNLPRFCDDAVRLSENGDKFLMYQTALGSSKIFEYLYSIALYYLIIYMIPFSCLTYMSICLCKTLRVTKEKRSQMTTSKKEENDITLSLVIVVVVYMTCQVLNPIRRVLFTIAPSTNKACGNLIIFATTFGIIFNSAVNFLIYCIFSPRFRHQLLQKFGRFNRVATASDSAATHNTSVEA